MDGTSPEQEPDELEGLAEALDELTDIDPADAPTVAHDIAERLARVLDSTDPI